MRLGLAVKTDEVVETIAAVEDILVTSDHT